jgi:hypothetical protein
MDIRIGQIIYETGMERNTSNIFTVFRSRKE